MFQTKQADKNLYTISISGIMLRLAKLQELDDKVQKIRTKSLDRYKDVDKILH